MVDERGGFDPDAAFVVVDCRGVGTLAPFARVDPALAALLWIEHSPASPAATGANALRSRLGELAGPAFAIKQGCIAGPRDRQGCFEIGAELIDAVLRAALAGDVLWETDPDFGYEVPARVPGVEGTAARAMLPRLRYADHDRVYEHAELVAAKKRERAAIGGGLEGLDAAIAAASGWPPAPSPGDWRE